MQATRLFVEAGRLAEFLGEHGAPDLHGLVVEGEAGGLGGVRLAVHPGQRLVLLAGQHEAVLGQRHGAHAAPEARLVHGQPEVDALRRVHALGAAQTYVVLLGHRVGHVGPRVAVDVLHVVRAAPRPLGVTVAVSVHRRRDCWQ